MTRPRLHGLRVAGHPEAGWNGSKHLQVQWFSTWHFEVSIGLLFDCVGMAGQRGGLGNNAKRLHDDIGQKPVLPAMR